MCMITLMFYDLSPCPSPSSGGVMGWVIRVNYPRLAAGKNTIFLLIEQFPMNCSIFGLAFCVLGKL